MTVKVASVLAKLIEAIENARLYEHAKWRNSKYFKAIDSCLEEAHELLHFELTRAPIQQESHPKVSRTVDQSVATRQSEAEQSNSKTISLPDEVLSVVLGFFKDSFHNPRNLSSNAYNFSLVCKSWHRAATQRLWQNVHLQDTKSSILFARSLHERHHSPTRAKDSPLSIGDLIRGLHLHSKANIVFPASVTYVLDCVNLFTRNIVSLNLKGLSTHIRPLKVTEFYEIVKLHPHLKHVWLSQVDIDSVEPIDPLPQLETCDCSFQWDSFLLEQVETLELISAKTISITSITMFKKDAVKSVYCEDLSLFQRQAPEFKQLTHLYLMNPDNFGEYVYEPLEDFIHIVKLPHLSFLILDNFTDLPSSSFDLIAKHCSLTTFVITWQPDEGSVESWIALIEKMGPKLLSVGVGLDEDEDLDDRNIFQAIYQNCPNLMTLELYRFNSPSHPWTLQHASDLENLCLLPLKWIYAPWFKKWPQNSKDSCPKFAKLCRLGLDVGLRHFPLVDSHLLDYNQPMRPDIVEEVFFS